MPIVDPSSPRAGPTAGIPCARPSTPFFIPSNISRTPWDTAGLETTLERASASVPTAEPAASIAPPRAGATSPSDFIRFPMPGVRLSTARRADSKTAISAACPASEFRASLTLPNTSARVCSGAPPAAVAAPATAPIIPARFPSTPPRSRQVWKATCIACSKDPSIAHSWKASENWLNPSASSGRY